MSRSGFIPQIDNIRFSKFANMYFIPNFAQSTGAVEYTDCFSTEG